MRISCPYCGERGNEEFVYLGSAAPVRPAEGATGQEWADYVFQRDNPAGPNAEYWQHVYGCRAWLVVKRDTRTHAILSVAAARDVDAAKGAV